MRAVSLLVALTSYTDKPVRPRLLPLFVLLPCAVLLKDITGAVIGPNTNMRGGLKRLKDKDRECVPCGKPLSNQPLVCVMRGRGREFVRMCVVHVCVLLS